MEYCDYIKYRQAQEERKKQLAAYEPLDCPDRSFWDHQGIDRKASTWEILQLLFVIMLFIFFICELILQL